MKDVFDVIIVGGGVVGCGIARELSRFRLNIIVLEQFNDVSAGTSKANSGIVHAGFDAEPGSLKAKYNIEGAAMFPRLAKELDFPYRQNGAMVLCFDVGDLPRLKRLLEKGMKNRAAYLPAGARRSLCADVGYSKPLRDEHRLRGKRLRKRRAFRVRLACDFYFTLGKSVFRFNRRRKKLCRTDGRKLRGRVRRRNQQHDLREKA